MKGGDEGTAVFAWTSEERSLALEAWDCDLDLERGAEVRGKERERGFSWRVGWKELSKSSMKRRRKRDGAIFFSSTIDQQWRLRERERDGEEGEARES